METLGQILQRLRQAAGLTQEQLAAKAGLSVHNIRNWEHDHREPGLGAVYKLSRALGVPMEEFGEPAAESPKTESKKASVKRPRGRPPKATPATPPAEDLEATAKKSPSRRRKK